MCVGENSKARQLKKFKRLQTKQHPTTKTIKGTVINLSDQKLDNAVYSLLQKGLKYAMRLFCTPIEDILAGRCGKSSAIPACGDGGRSQTRDRENNKKLLTTQR